MYNQVSNTHIEQSQVLITPIEIKSQLPLTDLAEITVLKSRQELESILDGKDQRKFLVVGPCSIHDPDAAYEYADRLKPVADAVRDLAHRLDDAYALGIHPLFVPQASEDDLRALTTQH